MKKIKTNSGAKGYQRNDTDDRCLEFRDWHRTLDKSLYSTDVDLVEFRFIDGEPVPVGTLEITRADKDKIVNNEYLDAILQRYNNRDAQKKIACYIAEKLGVKAWIVLYREGLSEFWVHCLSTEDSRWYHYDQKTLEKWLKSLEKGLRSG